MAHGTRHVGGSVVLFNMMQTASHGSSSSSSSNSDDSTPINGRRNHNKRRQGLSLSSLRGLVDAGAATGCFRCSNIMTTTMLLLVLYVALCDCASNVAAAFVTSHSSVLVNSRRSNSLYSPPAQQGVSTTTFTVPRRPPTRRRKGTTSIFQHLNNNNNKSLQQQHNQGEEPSKRSVNFTIRDCRYSDLSAVSDIILQAFYPKHKRQSAFRYMYKLSELNRLQQNFPHVDAHLHSMLVAVVRDASMEIVVGFVDVDARPPRPVRPDSPPRPYLSDLAVHPNFRNCGIAKSLVKKCQEICLQKFFLQDLYIRVERDNEIAINMYSKLNYNAQVHPVFGIKDTTTLLHKRLFETTTLNSSDEVKEDGKATATTLSNKEEEDNGGVGNKTAVVLDYVV